MEILWWQEVADTEGLLRTNTSGISLMYIWSDWPCEPNVWRQTIP